MNVYMDEMQDRLNELADKIEDLEYDNARLREQLADMVQSKPIPCKNVKETSWLGWFKKLTEETHEVLCAIYDIAKGTGTTMHIAEEITDVITVCTSFLDWMGYNDKAREKLQREVNEKNRVRNYF